MRRPIPRAVAAALFLVCTTGRGTAQEPSRIRAASTSPTTRLILEEALTIGSLNGEHDAFARVMNIAVDRRGRIFVADDRAHQIKVFAADGRYEATIGRRGEGPGEFDSPWNVAVDRTDSVFVWDVAPSRIIVFSPEFTYARSFAVPPAWLINGMTFDRSGNLVVAGFGGAARRGIQILERDGKVLREAGPDIQQVDLAGFEDSLLGGSVTAFGGGFVYARKSPVEITFLDPSLVPTQVCTGDSDWTTEPASVVERTNRGAGLHWDRYIRAASAIVLEGGEVLHTIHDPTTRSTRLQLVTPNCELVQTIDRPDRIIPVERRGNLLYSMRAIDFDEVVVHRLVWRP